MSLDVILELRPSRPEKFEDCLQILKAGSIGIEVYTDNITHNLCEMAQAAGIYYSLWRPEEIDFCYARQLIAPLRAALKRLQERPNYFKTFDATNSWGTYNDLVRFIENYLDACQQWPDANIKVWR